MTHQAGENSTHVKTVETSTTRHVQSGMIKAVSVIDAISMWSGKAVAFLIIPMVGSLVFEVICRYFFDSPTIWAGDMSTMLYGGFFMLGASYALQRQQHIRTDFLYEKWSIRTKGIVDSILYLTLYFPGLAIFMWISWGYAFRSVMLNERIVSSPWLPIIWPLKLTMPIATALLLMQGISEVTKSLYAARTGADLHEEVEGVET